MPYKVITRYPPTGLWSLLNTPNPNAQVNQKEDQANSRGLKKMEPEKSIAREIQVNLNDKEAFKISKLNYLFCEQNFWILVIWLSMDENPWGCWFLTSHIQLFLNLGFPQMPVFLGSVCLQIPGPHPTV